MLRVVYHNTQKEKRNDTRQQYVLRVPPTFFLRGHRCVVVFPCGPNLKFPNDSRY